MRDSFNEINITPLTDIFLVIYVHTPTTIVVVRINSK